MWAISKKAVLGVRVLEFDAHLATAKKLSTLRGVHVQSLAATSAAARAGLQASDVITAINDAAITTAAQLQALVARCRPGDKVRLRYLRGGEEAMTTATLLKAPPTPALGRASEG